MSASAPPGFPAGVLARPPVIVAAFLLLLLAAFAVAYSAGSSIGPVNPRMHPARTGVPAHDGNGTHGSGGMTGMDGM
ncbi:hypothetical protein [Streptomyces sp. NPDC008139]|uniref:hypothetical protein n=1 Tax=Streptomyces sp. NPDC008139 TaxID=3364814 RepID=UPI0036EEF9AF